MLTSCKPYRRINEIAIFKKTSVGIGKVTTLTEKNINRNKLIAVFLALHSLTTVKNILCLFRQILIG